MPIAVRTDRGRTLHLGRRVDSGGQGVVYEVEELPGHLAKLLLRSADPARDTRRLTSLMRHGRSLRTARLLALPHQAGLPRRAAWPIATITTCPARPAAAAPRQYAGFVMPDLRPQFRPLDCLVSVGPRLDCFPRATWATALAAAASLARLVADLHAAGYVVGDLKQGNLWADGAGQVAISDVDSFQFSDGAVFFACPARTPGYTAPEGIDVPDGTGLTLDESADNFVLAVLIYELLMAGMHPFFGRPGAGQPYLCIDDNVRHGRARVLAPDAVQVPRGAPPLSVLPRRLRTLFQLSFARHGPGRPAAADWLAALAAEQAGGRLRRCPVQASHLYTAERPWCPWCEIAGQGEDVYPPSVYA